MHVRHQAGAAVRLTFDNLGEVTALERGQWPQDAPLGQHWSVTRALPRVLELLDRAEVRATFFVEGLNAELYPDTLRGLDAAGHEVALHGWRHEQWAHLEPPRERELLERGVTAFDALGLKPVGFRPPGGELTPTTPTLLRELGFEYCSPAGTDPHVVDGVAVLPFRWELVDAWYYLPSFAGPPRPSALRAAITDAFDAGGDVTLIFHPFLTQPEERFEVLRDVASHVHGGPMRELGQRR